MDTFISSNLPDNPQKAKKFLSHPKIIFAILGAIILFELIYAVKVLNTPVASQSQKKTQAAVKTSGGTISLNSAKTSYKVKEQVSVTIGVETGGKVVGGADVIIHFDPKVLEATPSAILEGKIFGEYPLKSVDNKNGLISISGITTSGEGFTGLGEFATLNLRAKAVGNTSLTVEYQKNSTTDSNLVEAATSKDVLENIRNLQLTVQ